MRSRRRDGPPFAERARLLKATVSIVGVVEAAGIKVTWHGNEWRALCPFHPDRKPSFGGRRGEAFGHCFACGAHVDAIDFVSRHYNVTLLQALDTLENGAGLGTLSPAERERRKAEAALQAAKRAEHEAAERKANAEKARKLSRRVGPVEAGGLVDRYLIERRRLARPVDGWPGALGFMPEAWHPSGARVPALAAAAARWPSTTVSAVQLTALAETRRKGAGSTVDKAELAPSRWSIGVLQDGPAVRLAPYAPGAPLVLVEGVEDGLAIRQAVPGVAVWAVLGAATARNLALPDGAELVLAFDGDQAGREAAFDAALIFERRGHLVRIADLGEGRDPNSLLIEDLKA